MPAISVVVPVYKVEPYIHRCVESILNQSYKDFELILVDDGSPDNCGAICDGYAALDCRVHVIHQSNGGLSAARNAGIDWVFANSSSQWITFVDSDDWIHPQMLEQLLAAAQQHRTKISACGYQLTEGRSPEVSAEDLVSNTWAPKRFYMEHFVNATIACGKLYHADCFEQCRFPLGKTHEDEFLTYRLLFACNEIAVISAPLYAYYINPQGITRCDWSPKRLDAWEAYEQQIAFFQERGEEELVRFRYREFIDSGKRQLEAAGTAPNHGELQGVIRRMKRQLRSVVRRAWKRGYIHFWYDYDLLCQLAPLRTKCYRFWIDRVRRK